MQRLNNRELADRPTQPESLDAGLQGRGSLSKTSGAHALSLDVQSTLLSYPGAALIVDERLMVLGMNKPGEVLSGLLAAGPDVAAAETLRLSIREAILLGMPTEARVEIFDRTAELVKRVFDVSVLPLEGSDQAEHPVLVLGRESTLQNSLIEALVQSRELFQDLVKCSSDFAWETDKTGHFEFVSAKHTSGFSSELLRGACADDLIDRELSSIAPDFMPFSLDFPVEDIEVWLMASDGSPRCMLMTAVPVLDDEGSFVGTRGACVDVTQLRTSELLLKEARRREDLIDRIVGTIRAELEPAAMLRTAALEIGDVLRGDFGCILSLDLDTETFSLGASTSAEPHELDAQDAKRLDAMLESVEISDLKGEEGQLRVLEKSVDGDHVLMCGTISSGQINGALMISREEGEAEWTEEDRVLFLHIAAHMGIVLAQAAYAEALEALSRRDPLTGLLNRRAFFRDADICIARNERSSLPATYIYFDLDNFKSVNDTLGHGVGDQLLAAFSQEIGQMTRRGDLAVRLGGDEFGLLLDNCTAEAASQKVETIAEGLKRVAREMELPEDLSVSAGIAEWRPGSGQSVEQVLERADRVLYDAKRGGKSGWRIAEG